MGISLAPSMKTQLKGDKILHFNDAQICDITTQMDIATKHVMNQCLSSSPTTLRKKHIPFELCLRFKAIAKGKPPTMNAKDTPLHKMEDENVILHLEFDTTTSGIHHYCAPQYQIFVWY